METRTRLPKPLNTPEAPPSPQPRWLGILLIASALLFEVPLGKAGSSDLVWHEGSGFRAAPLRVPESGRPGFTQLPPDRTQILFTNQLSPAALAKNQLLEAGSGVALGDVDGDGHIDIYLCSMTGANRLYRNLGNWRFEEITHSPEIACHGQFSTGAVLADIDGDGDLDLLVNGLGSGTRLFVNEGKARFRERHDAGLVRKHGSTSMALADMDGDGFLDLYVANYHTRTFKDSHSGVRVEVRYVGKKLFINPPDLFQPLVLKSGKVSLFERGESDFLYRNTGRGSFVSMVWTNGTFTDSTGQRLSEAPKDWGLAVAFRDLNGDRAPDLYVCNDFFNSPDHVWLNDGSGHFRAMPPTALRQISMSSMAIDFADINRDGHDDFFVVDMLSREHERRHRQRGSLGHLQVERPILDPTFRPEYPRNTLFLGRGDGTYAEIAQYSGLEASEWSWGVLFLDVDLDGYEDVLITNGNLRDVNDADLSQNTQGTTDKGQNATAHPAPLETANLAFRNRGDLTFEECGETWGFDNIGVSHGMALADLDQDGDLDVVVNHMGKPVGLYRNDSSAPRVAVRPVGNLPNRQGIGATIELQGGAVERQSQQVISGGRYLSGDDPMRVFAAGTTPSAMTLKVTWRNGAQTLVNGVRANHIYEIHEPDAKSQPVRHPVSQPSVSEPPFFANVSAVLRHPHQEQAFNDFERQPMLPKQFSRLGPGLAWRDLDRNGWEDLIVGGASQGYGVIYLNDGKSGFKSVRRSEPLQQDQTTVLTFLSPHGTTELLIGSSNYESDRNVTPPVTRFDLQTGMESTIIGPQPWSLGPLALGFVEERLALFAGGRIRPGRYPESPGSQLYVLENGAWNLEPASTSALANAGMVSGAAWADLNGDGRVELLLACEWGPIRVYEFNQGSLKELTQTLQLHQYLGWWNGIATGDFDEDGRLDILASNWGRNTRYQSHRSQPLRLYYGDWMGFNRPDILEAYYNPARKEYLPLLPLDLLRATSPGLAEKYVVFAAYGRATVEEIIGMNEEQSSFLEANWLETTLFLNRGDRFEARILPAEAQFAPAFGVSISDFDGDGHEDVFLGQNFFGVPPDVSRYDAGRGLWLRGNGRGELSAVPGQVSGVVLYGEQRGTALADFDRDGRVDLAVGQNDGRIGLFRNVRAKPGLRIRLQGPTWNRDAIGAIIRLKYADRIGPARSVQIGSGYWSQESIVHVMASPARATSLWVRWPGGHVSEHQLLPHHREISVTYEPPRP